MQDFIGGGGGHSRISLGNDLPWYLNPQNLTVQVISRMDFHAPAHIALVIADLFTDAYVW